MRKPSEGEVLVGDEIAVQGLLTEAWSIEMIQHLPVGDQGCVLRCQVITAFPLLVASVTFAFDTQPMQVEIDRVR